MKNIIMRIKLIIISLCSVLFPHLASASVLKILEPANAPVSYHHAAAEFQKYYAAVTGITLEIIKSDDNTSDLVVIGHDFVNSFTRKCIENGVLHQLTLGEGSDAYSLVSSTDGDRKLLFLAGGSGRSTLYAVYDFFERQAGCQWFWDGDIIPHLDNIPMAGLDVTEAPRFQYRGIRYFAHRSLNRFQAEHWGPEDWEKEIDWALKKRLNLVMLRIGMDDVFQKAFPDIVPYPSNDGPFPGVISRSFHERTTPWPLEYRGQLRKHILQYARERELIHPEDVGTMTHWYSPTPKAFVDKVKPICFGQVAGGYMNNPCTAIWDIRIDENMENYWKLTQAHIDNYGSPEMFHTIGLAERNFFADRDQDVELKLYTYRRILSKVHEHYKNAPVLIAGWEFYIPGWTSDEISRLIPQLDPSNAIMFDYMSDLPTNDKQTNFMQWGVRHRFPYTFGIFHGYEAENDLRGYYRLMTQRLPEVVDDPMCCGFFFWPEMSHSDQLILEFFTHNAWKPDMMTPQEAVDELCRRRYGEYADQMRGAWLAALPLIQLCDELPRTFAWLYSFSGESLSESTIQQYRQALTDAKSASSNAAQVLRTIAALPFGKGCEFVDRDAIDLARTVLGRMFTVELYKYMIARYDKSSKSEIKRIGERAMTVLTSLRDVLSLSDDYSMNASMARLRQVNPDMNPAFEDTFKSNAENGYCRTYISELFDYYYIPQMKIILNDFGGKDAGPKMEAVVDAFYARPLSSMAPVTGKDFNESIYRYVDKLSSAR